MGSRLWEEVCCGAPSQPAILMRFTGSQLCITVTTAQQVPALMIKFIW